MTWYMISLPHLGSGLLLGKKGDHVHIMNGFQNLFLNM